MLVWYGSFFWNLELMHSTIAPLFMIFRSWGWDCNHKRRMFIPSVNTIAFWDFTSFQLFNYILLPPNYWIHCAVPGLSTQQCNRIKFVTHICKENNTFKNETKHQLVGGWVSVYSVNGIDVIISIETVLTPWVFPSCYRSREAMVSEAQSKPRQV